jgi:hypothetical protein
VQFHSELIAKFDIIKIHNASLTKEDLQELREAENLTRRFLAWNIEETVTSVRECLEEILATPSTVVKGEDAEHEREEKGKGNRNGKIWEVEEGEDDPRDVVNVGLDGAEGVDGYGHGVENWVRETQGAHHVGDVQRSPGSPEFVKPEALRS